MKIALFCVSLMVLVSCVGNGERSVEGVQQNQTATTASTSLPSDVRPNPLTGVCTEGLKGLPGKQNAEKIQQVCREVQMLPECKSSQGLPIYHFDKSGAEEKNLRIFAFSLIHGDEIQSGSVTRAWMERLVSIEPRNSWRIIPIVNPDGMKLNQRTNSHGVDLNRNFPTRDWHKMAYQHWKVKMQKDPRKYPGAKPASEQETQCILAHIQNFRPDFIIALHTPLGVLDFDGPKVNYPHYGTLPWIRLGNYPGSLGRYMWAEGNVPVLTIELKGMDILDNLSDLDRLQDASSLLAMLSNKKQAKERMTDD